MKVICIFLLAAIGVASGELDVNAEKNLCYPDSLQNTRKSCECRNKNMQPWGIRAIHIDCSFKEIKTTDLTSGLPIYADVLDLSWNLLTAVPQLSSESLRVLNLMHNNISVISANNFEQCKGLHELYLSWNSIQTIEPKAFNGLANLKILDLSHNNVHTLPLLVFANLLLLDQLNLSWNRRLNETISGDALTVHQHFGIRNELRVLKLEACSLSSLKLAPTATLLELIIRKNHLTSIPTMLPATLKMLDLSENLMKTLTAADTQILPQLQELYMEDMPQLTAIEENALLPLQSLRTLSLQNCRRLSTFNAYAFGQASPPTTFSDLHTIVLRGTGLHNLNATLAPVFRQLAELDLNGAPLYCDCELLWLKKLIETQGRCFQPANVRGVLVSEADAGEFGCNAWPHWVKGLIILCLIALCSAGIYLIVVGMRPARGVTMRVKVGSQSPYARVTVQPNQQDANY